MNAPSPAYGLWSLVIINSLVFIIFSFSFAKPQSNRDWRSFSAFRLHRGVVHRDVRLSAHHLSAIGMAR